MYSLRDQRRERPLCLTRILFVRCKRERRRLPVFLPLPPLRAELANARPSTTVLYSPIPDREQPEQIYWRFPLPRSGASGSYLQTHRAGNCTGGGRGGAAEENEEGGEGGDTDSPSTDATRGRLVNAVSTADFIVSLAVVFRTSLTPLTNC